MQLDHARQTLQVWLKIEKWMLPVVTKANVAATANLFFLIHNHNATKMGKLQA